MVLNKLEPYLLTKSLRNKISQLIKTAGLAITVKDVLNKIILGTIAGTIIAFLYFIFKIPIVWEYRLTNFIIVLTSTFILMFAAVFIMAVITAHLLLNLKIYKRKVAVEDVFPDFLQISATNIKAGMSVDKALWHSIRPRFGILAKEMETVAKKAMSGEELTQALEEFSEKYHSPSLKRAINLIIRGIESGGEIAQLLNKIAWNMQQNKITRKEMAANVTSYMIFISFASILMAPFLFALSTQLIGIMTSITSAIDLSGTEGVMSMPFALSGGGGLTEGDFRIFVYFCLTITSSFSAMLVSIISKGSVKDGMRFIPIFTIISLILFTIFRLILSSAFGKIF
ncbi:type II secretion system F family protein [Candidatus Woesearchaeota archaeon]|nr:type II secretion system F family protein [Candidatus Woesearchaeota archaeon]